ncbi:hypothetical protein MNBD_CPR01-265, partial [hydrothermal vent metagenome]
MKRCHSLDLIPSGVSHEGASHSVREGFMGFSVLGVKMTPKTENPAAS